MNSVEFSNAQPFPANNLSIQELVELAKMANPLVIEEMECTSCSNESQHIIKFKLAHLFKEFRVPQIFGEFVLDSKRNGDGSVEYSALPCMLTEFGKLETLSVHLAANGELITISASGLVSNDMPTLVINAAKRVVKLCMKATARYMSCFSAESTK